MIGFLKSIATFIVNIYLPITCFGCGKKISEPNRFCQECWRSIDFIGDNCCQKCGYKLHLENDENEKLCATCLTHNSSFDKIRSVCVYKDHCAKIIQRLKYHDGTNLALLISNLLFNLYSREFRDVDVILPVPIHTKTLRSRMYNQSLLLSKEMKRLIDINTQDKTKRPILASGLLIKNRHTSNQASLSKQERQKNIRHSMSVSLECAKLLSDPRVFLVVDDVVTTGATMEECARILKQKFPKSLVYGISFCRTLLQN